MRQMLHAKLHGATVTKSDMNYTGSIMIDCELLRQVDMLPFERVQVLNITNGARFETYIIEGAANSGAIEINGAAARLVQPGDKVIILGYLQLSEQEARDLKPKIAIMNDDNTIQELLHA